MFLRRAPGVSRWRHGHIKIKDKVNEGREGAYYRIHQDSDSDATRRDETRRIRRTENTDIIHLSCFKHWGGIGMYVAQGGMYMYVD